jgi:large subunit ribosomal protein L15
LIKNKRDGIKLLGHGEINYPLEVKVNFISQSARKKVETAGGTVEVLK